MTRYGDGAAQVGELIRWDVGQEVPRTERIGFHILTVMGVVQVYEVGPKHQLTLLSREVCLDWPDYWCTESELFGQLIAEEYDGFDDESVALMRQDGNLTREIRAVVAGVRAEIEVAVGRVFGPTIDIDEYARTLAYPGTPEQ